MSAQLAMLAGARLAYVVLPIEGELTRQRCTFDKVKGFTYEDKKEPGGYMAFFPQGHVVRLKTKEKLRQYNLDRKAPIINMAGLHDPESPLGKLMNAQDDKERSGAMKELQKMVINLATVRTGKLLLPEQVRHVIDDEENDDGPMTIKPRPPRQAKVADHVETEDEDAEVTIVAPKPQTRSRRKAA